MAVQEITKENERILMRAERLPVEIPSAVEVAASDQNLSFSSSLVKWNM